MVVITQDGKHTIFARPKPFKAVLFAILIVGAFFYFSKPVLHPPPPQSRTAVFRSADQNRSNQSLKISVTGGNYEIEYIVRSQWESTPQVVETPVFVVNFKTGETKGSLDDAKTIVLIGDLALRVGDTAGESTMTADMVTSGRVIHADFGYSQSPHWEPFSRRHIRVIVVGSLNDIGIGTARENSDRRISILDLDPNEAEISKYTEWRAAQRQQSWEDFVSEHLPGKDRPVEP